MIDLAATIEAMKATGMTSDEIVRALACVQPVETSTSTRTARQERNRRYYAKASEKRLKAAEQDVSDDVGPSPKESPQTPKEITPTNPSTHKENPLRGQKKGSRLPSDFEPDLGFATGLGLTRSQADTEWATFRDYWAAKTGQGATKADWQATWRNWVRRAAERLVPKARAGPYAKTSPIDHFRNLASELNGKDRDDRGFGGDRDDAPGIPIRTIEHHR